MTKEHQLYEALRDLKGIALAALLAYKTGSVLGTEYGEELQMSIDRVEKALQ